MFTSCPFASGRRKQSPRPRPRGNRAGLGTRSPFPPASSLTTWARGTPWSLQNWPRLCRGPHRLYHVPQTPWALPGWKGPHHSLKGPGKQRILTHLPWGAPCLVSSVRNVPTGRIFISSCSGPQLQTLSVDGRMKLIWGFTREDQVFLPKCYVGKKMAPFKETEGVTWVA